jgi:hypothetical protein
VYTLAVLCRTEVQLCILIHSVFSLVQLLAIVGFCGHVFVASFNSIVLKYILVSTIIGNIFSTKFCFHLFVFLSTNFQSVFMFVYQILIIPIITQYLWYQITGLNFLHAHTNSIGFRYTNKFRINLVWRTYLNLDDSSSIQRRLQRLDRVWVRAYTPHCSGLSSEERNIKLS